MSKADQDAAKWMENHAKWQERNLIKAKEQGDAYYINAQGDVVIPQEGKPAVIVKRDDICRNATDSEN
jgi:hypothetical protein